MTQGINLFLVPTPIAIEDYQASCNRRFWRVLSILAGRITRTDGSLLNSLEILLGPLQSYHFQWTQDSHALVDRWSGLSICFRLVMQVLLRFESRILFNLLREVFAVVWNVQWSPGATFDPALIAEWLPNDRFVFEAFLPHKKGE